MADPRTPPHALVLDMEGVLHVDWAALAGGPEAVQRFAAAGLEIAVLTNTTGRTRAEIAGRLAGLGMPVPAERIGTSASATAEHLRNAHPLRATRCCSAATWSRLCAPPLRSACRRASCGPGRARRSRRPRARSTCTSTIWPRSRTRSVSRRPESGANYARPGMDGAAAP